MDALRASLNRKGGNGAAADAADAQRIGRAQGDSQAADEKKTAKKSAKKVGGDARYAKPRKLAENRWHVSLADGAHAGAT